MSGLDDLLAESEDRWAKAERRSQGVADKGLGKAVRTYFTLYFPAGMVLLFIIGAVLGMLLFRGEFASARWYVFAGTMLAVIGTIASGITYNSKVIASSVAMGSMNVTMSLHTAEQKRAPPGNPGTGHAEASTPGSETCGRHSAEESTVNATRRGRTHP
ncbi:hypothetical protein [Pseudarthrobacter sp. fls2-241-R2A-127]|uniref:hypothetical protein n=1 Tax=Pseudarthrobacter sp. fls2-241-R2A-127 TaxID=3040303 RepID=UPI002554C695|nr:hypothetical protein [Pseudarthrobacter sp. fls2-241-R2A-127]